MVPRASLILMCGLQRIISIVTLVTNTHSTQTWGALSELPDSQSSPTAIPNKKDWAKVFSHRGLAFNRSLDPGINIHVMCISTTVDSTYLLFFFCFTPDWNISLMCIWDVSCLYASIHWSPMGPITHKHLLTGLRRADGFFFTCLKWWLKGPVCVVLNASNPTQTNR